MQKNMKHLKTTDNGNIFVYDDIFTKDKIENYSLFCQNSRFSLKSKSTDLFEHGNYANFLCKFNQDDVNAFGIFQENFFTESKLSNKNLHSCWILASTHLSKYYMHTDRSKNENGMTFLYYVNTVWNTDWGGETIFGDDRGEAEIAISFKPNRAIIFDSHIPHKPAPMSLDAPQYRFTFVAQFV